MDAKKERNAVNDVLKLPLADAFEADLAEALEAANEIENVVVVMLDMDGLLLINQNYGHAEGDRVLIELGQYLKTAVPESVRLYRYSGDEFAYLFTNGEEKEDVFLLMEDVRRNLNIESGGKPVTITLGVAAAPEDGTRYPELVRKADGAMYRGKHNGANRVCLAREEKMVTKTSHYTVEQLQRLTKLSKREGIGEAILLREALDTLLKKYDV